jgi:L-amino acid N-acyltransferase YncA
MYFLFTENIKAGTLLEVGMQFRVWINIILMPLAVEYSTQQLN